MINIKVLKDCAEVSYQVPGTTKHQVKIIGISEIPGLFDSKINFDSDLIPLFGTENAYGIQRIIQKDNKIIVLVQAINPYLNILHTNLSNIAFDDRQKLNISHIKKDSLDICEAKGDVFCYKNVHLPNLLMSIELIKSSSENWKVGNTGLLCYQDQFITKNTQLYDFPFSNIYRESIFGRICWGDEKPYANSITQSVGLIHTFLGAIMNTHLFDSFAINGFEFECSSQLLAYLSLRSDELNAFPYKDIPLKKVVKYEDLINYLTQNWK